jgi:hypothetical protein
MTFVIYTFTPGSTRASTPHRRWDQETSTDRILATHVGSLPRPPDLLDAVEAREQGKPLDEKAHAGDAKIASKAVVGEAGWAKARTLGLARRAYA